MLNLLLSICNWWISLFNPPPLASMSRGQKIGRILFITLSLVVSCILLAMVGAVGIFVLERGRKMLGDVPELVSGLEIMLVSACVNTVCVWVLLKISKMDRQRMAAKPEVT